VENGQIAYPVQRDHHRQQSFKDMFQGIAAIGTDVSCAVAPVRLRLGRGDDGGGE
jgi:hypothetical protein